ncbi:dihydrofolate reductase-like domain-containing protein [Geopyxis carbonaria]|nr:dihydrofolate reductase-like domain-containing protein [Geopyxis carbonaria]
MSSQPLTLIVAATSSSLGIGHAGALPWRIKSELAYFARVTKRADAPAQNVVIMGRKTYFSIPARFRPLPGRINVVMSRTPEALDVDEGVIKARSIDDALRFLAEKNENVGRLFVIGGAEIYKAAMENQRTQSILLTRVDTKFDCDVFFPVDVRKEGLGWANVGYDALCSFVGEDVPKGIQREGDVQFEYELWQKKVNES